MRILKRGVRPETLVYRASCYKCKSEFEFSRSEAQFHDDQRDGAYLSVDCPVCGNGCTVQANQGRAPNLTT